jgi:hypothetical protein
MAYLDPNQQLAMASGQLQQQVQQPFAMPGAYNAPSYATQTERAATTLTQGLTNIAMPGAALATSIGLGMVMPFGAPFRAGMSLGTLGRGFKGAGTLGRLAGVGLGGSAAVLSGIAVPMLAAQGIQSAATRMVEGQREFLATRQLMRELPNVGGMFGSQSVLSPGGFGPSAMASNPYQIQSLQNNLSNIGSVYGASSGQMRNIVGQLAPMGMVDTSSVDSISRSLRQSMRELTRIAKMVGSDLEEATQVYGQLKQMGFGTMSSRTQALRQLTGSSALSGMSLSDVTGMASGVISAANAAGIGSNAGLNMATSALATASVRQQAGAINPLYLQQVGGVGGYASRMAEIQLSMLGSEGAASAMSQMFDASGNLRAGGFEAAVRGRGPRSSFFDDYDPYRMGAMQRQFQGSSRALILGRVADIRSRYSGAEANRRQYDFLSGFGITDPTEQLEYLSSLRSQPRAQAMQTAQVLQNQMITAGGQSDPVGISERLSEGLRRLTQSVFGTGEALERYGASLQQRAEAFVTNVNNAVLGEAPTSARTGMYTNEAMNITLDAIASGTATFGYSDPMQRMRHQLTTDATFRQALGSSAAISGGAGPQRAGFGRLASQVMFALGAPVSGGGTSLYQRFGGTVGATAGRFDGTFVGRNDEGRQMFATADELAQMQAMSFGASYDPSTGAMLSADQLGVDELIFSRGQSIREVGNRLTYGREREVSTGRGGTTRIGGFAPGGLFGRSRAERERLVREGGTYQLSNAERESVRTNSETYITQYAREVYGRTNMSAQERVDLLEAMRQSGDQIAMIAAGETSGISPSEIYAATTEEAARAQFTTVLSDMRDAVTMGGRSVDDVVGELYNRGQYDAGNAVRRYSQEQDTAVINEAALRPLLNESMSGRASVRLARELTQDPAAQSEAQAFITEMEGMADQGNAMGATGRAYGMVAGAGDRNFGALSDFISGGGGGFGQLSGEDLNQALRTYVRSAGAGRKPEEILSDLQRRFGNMDPNTAEGRRAARVMRAVEREGQLLLPAGSQTQIDTLTQNITGDRDRLMMGLEQTMVGMRTAAEAAGQSVIERRALESVQQVSQNVLRGNDVIAALGTSRQRFTVGGREIGIADLENLSPAEAEELMRSESFRDALSAVQNDPTRGDAARRLLEQVDVLGTGRGAGRFQSVIQQILTDGIDEGELSRLSGITTQGNLAQLRVAMGEGGTRENLFDALGGEETALTVLSRLGVGENDVEAFLEQIQNDGMSGRQIGILSQVLGAASMLGEDVRRQNEEESFRKLQERVFTGLDNALNAGEGAGLAVFVRGSALSLFGSSGGNQDNAGEPAGVPQ